MAFVVFEVV